MNVINDSSFTIVWFYRNDGGYIVPGRNLAHIGWVFDIFEEDGNIEGEPAAFVPDLQVAALLRDLNNMHNECVYFAMPPDYGVDDFENCRKQVSETLEARAGARKESWARVLEAHRTGDE